MPAQKEGRVAPSSEAVTVCSLLEENSRLYAQKVCWVQPETDQELTYSQLQQRINRITNVFWALGVKKGERIGLVLPYGPELVFSYFGVLRAGTIAGIRAESDLEDFKPWVEAFQPKILVTRASTADKLRSWRSHSRTLKEILVFGSQHEPPGTVNGDQLMLVAPPELAEELKAERILPSNDAQVVNTGDGYHSFESVSTHRDLVHETLTFIDENEIGRDDCGVSVVPLRETVGSILGLLVPLLSGGKIVMPSGFLPLQLLETLNKERVTWLAALPEQLGLLIQTLKTRPETYPRNLRCVICAGKPCPPELRKELVRTFGMHVLRDQAFSAEVF